MLNKKIRILNFDGSVTRQKNLLSRYEADMLELKDAGARVRFWANRKDLEALKKRILPAPKNTVTFLGSGDFHHVTKVLLDEYKEPISVIDFDFHPDWDTVFPLLHCGSWVTHAMKRANIKKFVMIGIAPEDISVFSLQTGDLRLLKDDRLEMYPYSLKPSKVFFRNVPKNISLDIERRGFFTKIRWVELKNMDIKAFSQTLIGRIPTEKVYVTIDKDCLGDKDALTNWDQGELGLEHLLTILGAIKNGRDIAGMDITGDHSPVRIKGALKNIASWANHPKDIAAAKLEEPLITALNEKTNLKILELMTS